VYLFETETHALASLRHTRFVIIFIAIVSFARRFVLLPRDESHQTRPRDVHGHPVDFRRNNVIDRSNAFSALTGENPRETASIVIGLDHETVPRWLIVDRRPYIIIV